MGASRSWKHSRRSAIAASGSLSLTERYIRWVSKNKIPHSRSAMAVIDYASAVGIKSFPAAVIFAILYVPLLAYFIFKATQNISYVYLILILFCSIRVTSFILRALLAHVQADAENIHIFLAYQILYNTGFFGLLYSTYILATDRVAIAKNPPQGPIARLLRRRMLFRLILSAAVAIGITGAVDASMGTAASTINTGDTLRKVALYIFLVCAALIFVLVATLARNEFQDAEYRGSDAPVGATYGTYILFAICLLLLVRLIFFVATSDHASTQDNEGFWYPLAAVTEFIVIVLFVTPGLVAEKVV